MIMSERPGWRSRALLVAMWIALWFARTPLERSMLLQMVVQMPLLFGIGVLLATGRRARAHEAGAGFGLPSAILGSTGLMLWMIPRLLDAAVESVAIDALKFLSLPGAGFLLAAALRHAMPPVRLFILGNLAFMTAVVGKVLVDSPERLCVSYGASDQREAGSALIGLVLVLIAAVAAHGRRSRREAPPFLPATERD
jgi:hypothetical protein